MHMFYYNFVYSYAIEPPSDDKRTPQLFSTCLSLCVMVWCDGYKLSNKYVSLRDGLIDNRCRTRRIGSTPSVCSPRRTSTRSRSSRQRWVIKESNKYMGDVFLYLNTNGLDVRIGRGTRFALSFKKLTPILCIFFPLPPLTQSHYPFVCVCVQYEALKRDPRRAKKDSDDEQEEDEGYLAKSVVRPGVRSRHGYATISMVIVSLQEGRSLTIIVQTLPHFSCSSSLPT